MPTKAELEKEVRDLKLHIKRMNDQEREWGNMALALARRKGYCGDIQRFLDDHFVPYDKPTVTIKVNVSFLIEAEMADAQAEEYSTDFVQTCFNTEVFEQFGWRDAHDDDIEEITHVQVDFFEVTSIERID